MRGAWLPKRAGMMCARAVTGLAVLLGVCWAASAQAQVSVATFNALKSYTAVVAHNAQRLWVVDFVCKWNRLLAQATTATELPPVPGPVVEGQDCAGTGPAPEWPPAIDR